MRVTVRRATPADSADVLRWRNDPATRRASLDQRPVPRASHEAWYAGAIVDSRRVLYIGVDAAEQSVGMVRFDELDGGGAEVSINIAPERRGRGAGRALLIAAIERYRSEPRPGPLRARIRADNSASVRLFRGAGFTDAADPAAVIELVLDDDVRLSRADPS